MLKVCYAVVEITTHVLDLTKGKPAARLRVTLGRLADGILLPLRGTRTDEDGRSGPLLSGDDVTPALYELQFHIGDYFGTPDDSRFLDIVPLRFKVTSPVQPYHVPLLITPYGYSTYRGS
jgi:5-hydroxyisourate hydrolase